MVFAGALSVAALGALGIIHTPLAFAQEAAPAAEPASSAANVAQLNEEGSQLYRERDYRHAVEKFILAYAADPDPNLLFNIARCYEAMGDTDVAIEKYETFLTTPGADAQGKQRAREALKKLRQVQSGAQESTSAKPESAATQAGTPAAPARTSVDVKPVESRSSVLPWVTLGAGAAAAGFGGVMYMLGSKDHSTVTSTAGYNDSSRAAAMTEHEARDLVDSGSRKKMIGGVGLGVGGALLATSVVLFVTGSSNKSQEKSVALRMAPSTSGGTISLRGSF